MIAPEHRQPESRIQPDQWHPDPEAYRPPDADQSRFTKTVQQTVHRIGSQHPVLVIAAAASIGAILGCLVKRR